MIPPDEAFDEILFGASVGMKKNGASSQKNNIPTGKIKKIVSLIQRIGNC